MSKNEQPRETGSSDMTLDNVGAALRRLREAADLSLNDVVAALGWGRSRLSKYENGHLRLSLDVLDDIARALGHSPDAVILYCLTHRYPQMLGAETRKEVEELLRSGRRC